MEEKRYLTSDEIEYCLDWLNGSFFSSNPGRARGIIPGLYSEIALSYKNTFKRQLRREKVEPSKIETLRDKLRDTFRKSVVEPGFPAGKIAGTSTGEITSQLTLKAGKGQLGSSATGKSRDMMQRFESLLSVSPTRQEIEIYFKRRHTVLELYLRRRFYQSLYLKIDLGKVEFSASSVLLEAPWYDLYWENYPRENIISEGGMRIHFDTVFLYGYQLSLAEIAKKIKTPDLIITFSPQALGVIDIFPRTNTLNSNYTPLMLAEFERKSFSSINYIPTPSTYQAPSLTGSRTEGTGVFTPIVGKRTENTGVVLTKAQEIEETEEPEGEEPKELEEGVISSEEELESDAEELIDEISDEEGESSVAGEESHTGKESHTGQESYSEEDLLAQQFYYLRSEILPKISTIQFGFLPAVPAVEINWTRIDAVVQTEKKNSSGEARTETFDLILSRKVITEKGITPEMLENILREIGWIKVDCQNCRLTVIPTPGGNPPSQS